MLSTYIYFIHRFLTFDCFNLVIFNHCYGFILHIFYSLLSIFWYHLFVCFLCVVSTTFGCIFLWKVFYELNWVELLTRQVCSWLSAYMQLIDHQRVFIWKISEFRQQQSWLVKRLQENESQTGRRNSFYSGPTCVGKERYYQKKIWSRSNS